LTQWSELWLMPQCKPAIANMVRRGPWQGDAAGKKQPGRSSRRSCGRTPSKRAAAQAAGGAAVGAVVEATAKASHPNQGVTGAVVERLQMVQPGRSSGRSCGWGAAVQAVEEAVDGTA
jgi:hypothetical protein